MNKFNGEKVVPGRRETNADYSGREESKEIELKSDGKRGLKYKHLDIEVTLTHQLFVNKRLPDLDIFGHVLLHISEQFQKA
jgi:hypothetical protein